jgi:hypothetical protein
MAGLDAKMVYRLEAAMSELDAAADELEENAERISALLALLQRPYSDPPFDFPIESMGLIYPLLSAERNRRQAHWPAPLARRANASTLVR